MNVQPQEKPGQHALIERCLAAFVQAGTIELSLDRLAESVGISKRMLIHYFGDRETIEEGAMSLLEERLRAQFSPASLPHAASLKTAVVALWDRTTASNSHNVLLLVMDLSRRAWNGSLRARAFYAEQQRLWVDLLMNFHPNRIVVEEVLQLFQGAVLAYLITGDPEPGHRSLVRFFSTGQAKTGNSAHSKRPR
jgi:AcrR family transcriptional regulator